MSLYVRYTDRFIESLQSIIDFYQDKNISFVDRVQNEVNDCIRYIQDMPFMFPLVNDRIRKAVLKSGYIIRYSVIDDTIIILNIQHGRQKQKKISL